MINSISLHFILFICSNYSPILIYSDLIPVDNNTFTCFFTSIHLISWLDITYKFFVEAILMTLFSILLIYRIFSSRPTHQEFSIQQRRKDMHLDIICAFH